MKILTDIQQAADTLVTALSAFDKDQFSTAPQQDAWSAGQVAEHLIKSTDSITQFLSTSGTVAERKPDERVEELKGIFLDYNKKMKSPAFILPTQTAYDKENVISTVINSYRQLQITAGEVNLNETITHRAFGDITKLELLYFVTLHTQRHTQQIHDIIKAITNKHS